MNGFNVVVWVRRSSLVSIAMVSFWFTWTFYTPLVGAGGLVVVFLLVYGLEGSKWSQTDASANWLVEFAPVVSRVVALVLSFGVALSLSLASAANTVGGLAVQGHLTAQALQEESEAKSTRIPALKRELVDLEDQIAQDKADISVYSEKGYIGNLRKSKADLERHISRRDTITQELEHLEGVAATRDLAASGVAPQLAMVARGWLALGLPSVARGELDHVQAFALAWQIAIGLLLELLLGSLVLADKVERKRLSPQYPELESQQSPVYLDKTSVEVSRIEGDTLYPENGEKPEDTEDIDLGRVEAGKRADSWIILGGKRFWWTLDHEMRYQEILPDILAGVVAPNMNTIKALMGAGDTVAEAVKSRLVFEGWAVWKGKRVELRVMFKDQEAAKAAILEKYTERGMASA